MTLRVQDDEVTFNMSEAVYYPTEKKECLRVDKVKDYIVETGVTKESSIDDSSSEESICTVETPATPWYADIVNYLACDFIPVELSYQRKKKLLSDMKHYQWEDPLLYKHYADQIIRRCVPEDEMRSILHHCHEREFGDTSDL